jgi:hypothetical protein
MRSVAAVTATAMAAMVRPGLFIRAPSRIGHL